LVPVLELGLPPLMNITAATKMISVTEVHDDAIIPTTMTMATTDALEELAGITTKMTAHTESRLASVQGGRPSQVLRHLPTWEAPLRTRREQRKWENLADTETLVLLPEKKSQPGRRLVHPRNRVAARCRRRSAPDGSRKQEVEN
jgi:hypothetical protein